MTGDQGFELSPKRQKVLEDLIDRGQPVFDSIASYVVLSPIAPKTFDRWVNNNWKREFDEGLDFTRFLDVDPGMKPNERRHIADHLKDSVLMQLTSGDEASDLQEGIFKRIKENPGLPFDDSTLRLRNVTNKLAPPQTRGTTDPGNR